MKVYVATNTETHEGQEKEFYTLGVYSTPEKAMEGLKKQAEADMACLDEEDALKFEKRYVTDGFYLTNGYSIYEYDYWERTIDDEEGSV